jgi:hypothetical protein
MTVALSRQAVKPDRFRGPPESHLSLVCRNFSAILEHMFVSLVDLEKEYRELEALTAAWLTHLAEYDRSGDFALDGYANTAVAVRTVCRMTPGVAKGHVDLARKLESLPAVAEAFGRGEITRAHAVVVANACTAERADAITNLESAFVEAAKEHSPNGLAAVVQHATDAIDGDGGASNDEKLRGRRRAHLSKTFDGMGVLDGLFDPADTDYLERSVKTEMERDRTAGDGRSTPQRRADAFMNLIRRGAVRAELGSVRAVSRHFVVAVDVDDFYSPERIEELRLEVRRSGYLSAATLERICCDAQISRVIMAGKSEVLDVGRTTRTVTPALWAALVARDEHCQAPGCDRPHADCEAHHIEHWSRGGPTSLDNLKLYCWKHHRERHQHDAETRIHKRTNRYGGHSPPAPDTHRPKTPSTAPRPQRV